MVQVTPVSLWDAKTGVLQVQSQPGLQSELKVDPGQLNENLFQNQTFKFVWVHLWQEGVGGAGGGGWRGMSYPSW